jgi:hypothetical protein
MIGGWGSGNRRNRTFSPVAPYLFFSENIYLNYCVVKSLKAEYWQAPNIGHNRKGNGMKIKKILITIQFYRHLLPYFGPSYIWMNLNKEKRWPPYIHLFEPFGP